MLHDRTAYSGISFREKKQEFHSAKKKQEFHSINKITQ